LGDKSLKSQLRQANNWGINQVIIIGEEELKRGRLILRDMARGEQKEIVSSELLSYLEKFRINPSPSTGDG
jgi:histidyl-tRNA synthetase